MRSNPADIEIDTIRLLGFHPGDDVIARAREAAKPWRETPFDLKAHVPRIMRILREKE